jgi:hypothetical protein
VLAGLLTAGATALAGAIVQIDAHLIWIGTAPLTLAPDQTLVMAEVLPFRRLCEALPCFDGSRIRSELLYSLYRPVRQARPFAFTRTPVNGDYLARARGRA